MPTYRGSCHCGGVTFTIGAEISELTTCDCSLCRQKNALMTKAHGSALIVTSGEDLLSAYQWNTHRAKHFFCSRCGIYTFHRKRGAGSFRNQRVLSRGLRSRLGSGARNRGDRDVGGRSERAELVAGAAGSPLSYKLLGETSSSREIGELKEYWTRGSYVQLSQACWWEVRPRRRYASTQRRPTVLPPKHNGRVATITCRRSARSSRQRFASAKVISIQPRFCWFG